MASWAPAPAAAKRATAPAAGAAAAVKRAPASSTGAAAASASRSWTRLIKPGSLHFFPGHGFEADSL